MREEEEEEEEKKTSTTSLTWSPPHGSLLPAAEAHLAEHAEEVPLAYRPRVFAGTRATLGRGHAVAVRFPRLTLLADQGAGDRGHLALPLLGGPVRAEPNRTESNRIEPRLNRRQEIKG
ncbi:hypothetical protein CRUP_012622 [Coryphaenoides rupestris]|nr:hypothetical protein CRUP_012622 [Coryphaenoides rupestris]